MNIVDIINLTNYAALLKANYDKTKIKLQVADDFSLNKLDLSPVKVRISNIRDNTEIQNILSHYSNVGGNYECYMIEAFDKVLSKYSDKLIPEILDEAEKLIIKQNKDTINESRDILNTISDKYHTDMV